MAREGLPINPKVLEWARTRAGLSLEDAAKKFAHIQQWEGGTSSPSYPQLEQLAEAFKVPIAVFFFPEVPKTVPIRESFRTLPDVDFDRIPGRVAYLLRKAKALQLNLPELAQGSNPAPRLITRDLAFDESTSIETMATRVRDYLGVSLADQYAWRDDETALKSWRKALQGVGIFVFKDAFKAEDFSGFSLYDDMFPIVYVNNSSTKTRQMFTLFHELAHLLFHTSGIDTIKDGYISGLPVRERRIEVMCNEFAARFLVPRQAFDEAVAGMDHTELTAEVLAGRFHVSREVIFRMFLDRGWIDQAEYAEAAHRWALQKQSGGGGGNPYRTQIAYLGRDYIELALKQYYQNRIDDIQLAEYLNMKPRNVGTLEDYFSRVPQ